MVNTILPGVQGEETYKIKIPVNNTAGNVAEAVITNYVPKKEK